LRCSLASRWFVPKSKMSFWGCWRSIEERLKRNACRHSIFLRRSSNKKASSPADKDVNLRAPNFSNVGVYVAIMFFLGVPLLVWNLDRRVRRAEPKYRFNHLQTDTDTKIKRIPAGMHARGLDSQSFNFNAHELNLKFMVSSPAFAS
jgi:hypothetical protein